jgi:hypothetical protein
MASGRLARAVWRFHPPRHFFATMLIAQHVEPQELQRALLHKTLTHRRGPDSRSSAL